MSEGRNLSLAKSVAEYGGLEKWNSQPKLKALDAMLETMCTATTKEEALEQVNGIISLGHYLWAYMYMRKLAAKSVDLLHVSAVPRQRVQRGSPWAQPDSPCHASTPPV